MTTTAATSCPTHRIKQTVAPAAAGATALFGKCRIQTASKTGSLSAFPPPSVPLFQEHTDSSDSVAPLNPVDTTMSHVFSFQNPFRG